MQQETSEWVTEFQSNLVQLETTARRPSLAATRPRPGSGSREGDAGRPPSAEPASPPAPPVGR
jgi:hypothetical protein